MQQEKTPNRAAAPGGDGRVGLLDSLRGFAILGILLINVQSFGLLSSAFLNPKALGEPPVADYSVWLITHLLVDEKFITILTLLFGAGIVLMAERSKLEAQEFERVFRRRMLWLLGIGLAHGLLLWRGDILTSYAICAMAAVHFRDRTPWQLLKIALVLLLVPTVIAVLMTIGLHFLPPERLQEIANAHWLPSREVIRSEVALYTGPWLSTMGARALDGLTIQGWMLITERFWRVLALMLIGMALLRIGFLRGQWEPQQYRRIGLRALAIGLPLVALGVLLNEVFGWDLRYSLYLGDIANYWASALVAIGWIALLALLFQFNLLGRISLWLTAVGRLALSNYLLQTLICASLFYGFGLGLYGELDRPMLLLVVLGIWITQILLSIWYLKHFKVGPFEWAWRRASARPLFA